MWRTQGCRGLPQLLSEARAERRLVLARHLWLQYVGVHLAVSYPTFPEVSWIEASESSGMSHSPVEVIDFQCPTTGVVRCDIVSDGGHSSLNLSCVDDGLWILCLGGLRLPSLFPGRCPLSLSCRPNGMIFGSSSPLRHMNLSVGWGCVYAD